MDIIYTDEAGNDVGILQRAYFDCAFGSGENNFELTLDAESNIRISKGARVYIEGTEYGGVVDSYAYDSAAGTYKYSGRSVHGLLASKLIRPPAGADYLVINNEVHAALRDIVRQCGLDSLIKVVDTASSFTAKYQFDRFIDAYSGIVKMLKAQNARPKFVWVDGKTISLEAVQITSNPALDTDVMDHNFKHIHHPVSHLVCLGKGELKDRTVIDLYADAKGNVSKTQSIFGVDEVEEKYDYNGAEAEELEREGIKKLKELQNASSADINLKSDASYAVGDIITSYDIKTAMEVSAQVTKKIITCAGDDVSIEYAVGGTAQSTSLSGSVGASSGGGITYTAGEGIKISNATITADVTQPKLDAVKNDVDVANASLSNVTAELPQIKIDIAKAQSTADVANITAAEALEAAKKAGSVDVAALVATQEYDSKNGIRARRVGKFVAGTINGFKANLTSSWASQVIGTLPEGMRPTFNIETSCTTANTNANVAVEIRTDGVMTAWNVGGTSLGNQNIYANFAYTTE